MTPETLQAWRVSGAAVARRSASVELAVTTPLPNRLHRSPRHWSTIRPSVFWISSFGPQNQRSTCPQGRSLPSPSCGRPEPYRGGSNVGDHDHFFGTEGSFSALARCPLGIAAAVNDLVFDPAAGCTERMSILAHPSASRIMTFSVKGLAPYTVS